MRYTQEQRDFYAEYIPGHSCREVADEFNRRFCRRVTHEDVHSYKCNHRIKSGTPTGKPKGSGPTFPTEVAEYIAGVNKGKTAAEVAEMTSARFGRRYTAAQIKGYRARAKLISGLTGRFKKGRTPQNKGKKGVCAPGCEKGWFRKGQVPYNWVPVGTESVIDGYHKVKVAEPNVWRFKHVMEWEKKNGPVPEGSVLTFKDGDRDNCSPENLMCVPRAIHGIMNVKGLRSRSPEVTETGAALAKVMQATREAERLLKGE